MKIWKNIFYLLILNFEYALKRKMLYIYILLIYIILNWTSYLYMNVIIIFFLFPSSFKLIFFKNDGQNPRRKKIEENGGEVGVWVLSVESSGKSLFFIFNLL